MNLLEKYQSEIVQKKRDPSLAISSLSNISEQVIRNYNAGNIDIKTCTKIMTEIHKDVLKILDMEDENNE